MLHGMRRLGTSAGFLVLFAAACGPHLMKLPAGRGVPVPGDAPAPAYLDATKHCDAIRTLTAVVAVNGTAGGRRVRGRLLAGVADPASVRLEAVNYKSPFRHMAWHPSGLR